jgi:energy-coupling factor transporter ATP-binding protein EcfA2
MPEPLLSRIEAWQQQLTTTELLKPELARELTCQLSESRAANLEAPASTLLSVLLLGPTGAGKSELLNALAGARIAQSHFLRPTTTQPIIYAHESVTSDELSQYSELLARTASHPSSLVSHNVAELRDKLIIDAPDIDSFRTEHRQTVLALLPVVDVVLYVVTPFSYKDDIGWQTVLEQRGRRAFAFIINKWDPEGKPDVSTDVPDADTDLLQLLRTRTGYNEPRLFRTSARYQLQRKLGELPAGTLAPPGEQFAELEQWLSSGLAGSHIAHIHERRRLQLWDALAASVTQAIPPEADWSIWSKNLQGALLTLEHDGRKIVQPFLIERAREINATRRSDRPRAFGLLGLIVHAVSSVSVWRPLRGSLPVVPSLSLNEEPAGPEAVSEKLRALAELRISGLGWAAQQAQLQIDALQRDWANQLQSLSTQMQQALLSSTASLLGRRASSWRRATAITILAALEVATIALLGLAIWRIAKGFLYEQYVSLPFALSLLALFATLLILAALVHVLILPTSEAAALRELERPVVERWNQEVAAVAHTAEQYVHTYNDLREECRRLERECTAHAKHSSNALALMQNHASAAELDQLFANTEIES